MPHPQPRNAPIKAITDHACVLYLGRFCDVPSFVSKVVLNFITLLGVRIQHTCINVRSGRMLPIEQCGYAAMHHAGTS